MKTPSQDWIEDSTRWHRKVLDGKYAHWCADWDDLPIDETCFEFTCCICYESTPEIEEIKNKLRTRYELIAKNLL